MRKILLFTVLACLFGTATVQAQLSTRENNDQKFLMGVRPEAGTWSLNFGLPITNGNAALGLNNFLGQGNVLTGTYFKTSTLAYRGGLRLFKNSSVSNGTIADSSISTPPSMFKTNEFKSSSRNYIFSAGLEKHFSNSNFFDVYAGADLMAGFGKNLMVNNVELRNGDFTNQKSVMSTTNVGLGGVIGVSMFISNLPISLGVEYGWSALWTFGGKNKVTEEGQIGGTGYNVEYFTQDTDPFGGTDPNFYSDLSRRNFVMDNNHDVKIVLRIFFGCDCDKDGN